MNISRHILAATTMTGGETILAIIIVAGICYVVYKGIKWLMERHSRGMSQDGPRPRTWHYVAGPVGHYRED